MVYLFIANGFEEIEGLTVVDLMRRAGIEIQTVSITGEKTVTGSHGISVIADMNFDEADFEKCDMIVLPGGMPGTTNLCDHKELNDKIKEFYENGQNVAAICAAPMVFGRLGILAGHNATIYKGMEDELVGAKPCTDKVVVSKNVITSQGPGTAMDFALKLIEIIKGEDISNNVAKGLLYR